jgi:hypothetical protein
LVEISRSYARILTGDHGVIAAVHARESGMRIASGINRPSMGAGCLLKAGQDPEAICIKTVAIQAQRRPQCTG